MTLLHYICGFLSSPSSLQRPPASTSTIILDPFTLFTPSRLYVALVFILCLSHTFRPAEINDHRLALADIPTSSRRSIFTCWSKLRRGLQSIDRTPYSSLHFCSRQDCSSHFALQSDERIAFRLYPLFSANRGLQPATAPSSNCSTAGYTLCRHISSICHHFNTEDQVLCFPLCYQAEYVKYGSTRRVLPGYVSTLDCATPTGYWCP